MRVNVAVPPSPEITGAARVERPGALGCTDVLLPPEGMRFVWELRGGAPEEPGITADFFASMDLGSVFVSSLV